VFGLFVKETRSSLEKLIRGPDHPVPLGENLLQELNYLKYVGLGAGDVNLAPDEYPEGVGNIVLGRGDLLQVIEDQFLLVIGEEVCKGAPDRVTCVSLLTLRMRYSLP